MPAYHHRGPKDGPAKNLSFVQKLYSIPPTYRDGNDDNRIERAKKNDVLVQSVVNDGGLPGTPFRLSRDNWSSTPEVVFSLNKRKRWELPGLLCEAIEQNSFNEAQPAMNMNISYLVRRGEEAQDTKDSWDKYGYHSFKLRPRPTVLEVTSTAFGEQKTMTPARPQRGTFLTDLVAKAILLDDQSGEEKSYATDKSGSENDDSEDEMDNGKSPSLQCRARNLDLGILYQFSVQDRRYGTLPNRKSSRSPTLLQVRKSTVDLKKMIQRRQVACPSVPLSDEEDHAENDVDDGEQVFQEKPREAFDLSELIDAAPKSTRKRSWSNSGSSGRSSRSLRNNTLVYCEKELDPTEPETPAPADWPLILPAEPSVILSYSQRTHLLPGITFARLDELLLDLAGKAQYPFVPLMCGADPDTERVLFSHTGLDVAVCSVFRPTLFGLECSVKGPEKWLNLFDEICTVNEIFSELMLPEKKVLETQLTSVEEDLCTPYKSLFAVRALDTLLVTRFGTDPPAMEVTLPCFICQDVTVQHWRNACGHFACSTCWRSQITARITSGILTCLAGKCTEPIDPFLVGLLAPWGALQSWQSRNIQMTISRDGAAYCSSPGCRYIFMDATSAKDSARTLRHCAGCRKSACDSCGKEWHWPCPCDKADVYNKILASKNDDPWRYSREPRYLAQTKKCPGCKTVMEKGEGCNHMTCNCGMHFCWFCAKPLAAHNDEQGNHIGCGGERTLDTIDVEGEEQMRWREAAYFVAVELRRMRFELTKKKQIDARVKRVAYLSYSVMEHVSAFESQAGNCQVAKAARMEVGKLRFAVQVLLQSNSDAKYQHLCGLMKSYFANLRSMFRLVNTPKTANDT